MPFGVRGVRPEQAGNELVRMTLNVSNAFRREGRSPHEARFLIASAKQLSPMPFGVRGVRPGPGTEKTRKQNQVVSNAFRREGRSPREYRRRLIVELKGVSNAFRREGRSPRRRNRPAPAP